MKFIKRYRYTIIMILVFILLVCLGVKIKEMLVPDDNKASYGNRLNELSEHEIEESLYLKIKAELESRENVSKLTYRRQGKIINFIVTVADSVAIKDAKVIGDDIINYFQEDDINYYTFQIYVKKDDTKLNNFPIVGAKNPLTDKIVWTQDREIVEGEKADED